MKKEKNKVNKKPRNKKDDLAEIRRDLDDIIGSLHVLNQKIIQYQNNFG